MRNRINEKQRFALFIANLDLCRPTREIILKDSLSAEKTKLLLAIVKDKVTIKRQELLKAGFPATTVGELERLGILSFDYLGPNEIQ
jgi:hypothetical protein